MPNELGLIDEARALFFQTDYLYTNVVLRTPTYANPLHNSSHSTLTSVLGVKVRNMKMDFNTGGT